MTVYTSRHKLWRATNTQAKIDAMFTPEVLERFWAKVDVRGDDDCWNWTGTLTHHGYGNFFAAGHNQRANRVAWLITHGPIPADLHVLHSCDNRRCVNPAHLSVGTIQDNYRQRDAQLKCTKGEKHHSARLTEADVFEIRASDEPVGVLAKRYGVHYCSILKVQRGITWKHLLPENAHRVKNSRQNANVSGAS